MKIEQEVLRILDEVLGLQGRSSAYTQETLLLGAVPELDSMAVVSIIAALEDRLGISVDDGDIDGTTFESVGSLVRYVTERQSA